MDGNQNLLKRYLIVMNQCTRQTAKNSVQKEFFKLMSNANFGHDYRNNLDNCRFVSICDELIEISCFTTCFTRTFLNLFRINYLRGKLTKNLMTK